MMDPKTEDDASLLGEEWYDVPTFVDTSCETARSISRFYFGLTIIRVETVFENPKGKDVKHTLVVHHNYHGN